MKKLVLATLALAGLVSASTATFAQQRTCTTTRSGNAYVTRCY